MNAVLFWENKQIQISKNITKTGQTPFTIIEVAGCHRKEAGRRDSFEQLCSVDDVHIKWVCSAHQSDSRTRPLALVCQAAHVKGGASRQLPRNERYSVRCQMFVTAPRSCPAHEIRWSIDKYLNTVYDDDNFLPKGFLKAHWHCLLQLLITRPVDEMMKPDIHSSNLLQQDSRDCAS